ncbi:hypothetical protein GRI32_09500 [Altererythrobacter aestuarii]|uniref:JmjC domain-containing protein n=1 Tax=Alteraurantiacibacter aestuarii TaxID=650004 RepID=A0A844ZN56_9SPHN|nr:hypothetical protein [Alteraurantiacibacter aestuarii]
MSPQEFFDSWYEREYYRTPGPVAAVQDLLSIDRIDEIISDSELPPTSLTMAKSGQGLPAEEYTFANGVIDRGSVLDNFRNGATIVLPQLHFADGKLYTFCLALEREFGARIQTNIYLTPSNAHGFGIHYDDHDVFVIQVSGSKKWEIYGNREQLPFKGEGFRRERDDVGELRESFTLNPGECLYVPRGMAHRAPNEGDEVSLHITVGIIVQTWAEFMLEAVAEASLRIPEMRHSLPRTLYFNEGERAANEAIFRSLVDQLRDKANFEATLSVFGSNFIMDQGTRVRGALNTLAAGIAADDRFRVREGILYSMELEGEEPQVTLAGSAITLKPDLAPQLAERLAAGNLAISDFSVEDAEDLRDTVETLVAFGLLERA